jgi:hypothetical protein
MGSTICGDEDHGSVGMPAPQDIELDRGNGGRVRIGDRA